MLNKNFIFGMIYFIPIIIMFFIWLYKNFVLSNRGDSGDKTPSAALRDNKVAR